MAKDLSIYVFTHKKPSFDIIEDETHIPIQVGAFYTKEDICKIKDDTLDNISEKNPLYSELTGIYWVWKNRGGDKYVGCEHYRRHFDLTEAEIKEILSNNEIILPRKYILNITSLEDFHRVCHNINDLKLCEDIIYDLYPEYKDSYEKYIKNSNLLYIANSFITTSENFNNLCNFLFSIFFEFERRKGFTTIDEWKTYVKESNIQICPREHKNNGLTWEDYQLRIFAFLAERLLTLYVLHNFNGKIYETDLVRLDIQNMKTLVCCIGKNENRYVREYVEWYKKIGLTHIRLYDNNDIDGERFEDSIGDYINSGFVELVDYRGKVQCQLQAYEECYKELGGEYDWILFIDCGDEYLHLVNHKTITDFLSDDMFKDYDMLHLNLMTFGDCGHLTYEDKPLIERFPRPIPFDTKVAYDFPENAHVSSIVRGGLKEVLFRSTPHTPYPNNLRCCNDVGEEVNSNSPFSNISFRNAFFRHYTTKTAEEYCNKMRRGFPDQIWDNSRIANLVETRFFRTNEVTKEKVELFKRELGVDMSHLIIEPFDGEKDKNVKIYSLCYEKKNFPFLDNEVITPLQVGAANGTNVCGLKDNVGDNISSGNYFYIENTGTYWIWKNVKDAKYKGQMQYRRPLSGVTPEMNFEEVFTNYDVITCEPFHHPSHKTPTAEQPMIISADTVEQGYAFSNCLDDLLILEMAVKMYYPDYADDYDKYIKNGPNLYYSNGFIMKAEDYDRYCEFLFNCLNGYLMLADIRSEKDLVEHVKYNLEVGKYQRYPDHRRVPTEAIKWQCSIGGFLSERLWTLWLQHNFSDDKVLKLPYIKMEEKMYT